MKKTQLLFARYLTLLILALLSTNLAWGETKTLTFNLTSNPGSWPTTNSTTLTSYKYKLDNVDYTFGLKNVKCNSGYLMLTSTAVLGLPAIEGYKLTKVVAKNSGGCSTSTKVGVSSSSSSASYISGGAIQTWSTTSSSYTYNLSGTSNNTVYYLYVTNKNAQITELALTYEGQSAPVAVEAPTFSVAAGNYTEAQTVELSCATEGASIYYTTDGTEPSAKSTLYESAIAVNKSMTIKAIAIKGAEKSTVATAAYKINVFTSLEDLVAVEIADGTTVKVSFENVMITDIYTNSIDKRVGIFLNVKAKNDKDIEIYFNNTAEGKTVPDAWKVGGKVSGTLTCPWTYYKNGDVWELCPAKDSEWTWNELTYTAPSTEYNINIADGIQYGTVSADMVKAAEGVEVTLTINPEEGYKLSTLTVKDAAEGDVTVTDNKFTMPASDVYVSATFEAIPTHDAKFFVNGVQYGETQNVPEGDEVVFPEEDPAAIGTRNFVGWTASPMSEVSDEAPEFVKSATMGIEDLNFYAVYAKKTEGDGNYEKVTTALTDWRGKYLIVYETENVAFDGSLTTLDAEGNTKEVEITDNIIASSEAMDAIAFTVAYKTGSSTVYSLKSASGYYISGTAAGNKAGNGLKQADTDEDYEISFNGITVESKSSDQQMVLKYNKASDQKRFRFYKSGQQDIALYKKQGTTYSGYCTTVVPCTFTVEVNENAATGLTTMYLDYATEIPEGAEAWYVSGYDADKDCLTMAQITGCVPANTAVIVKGTAGESYEFVETFEDADPVSVNLLVGSVTDDEATDYDENDGWYYLALSGNFKKYVGEGIVRKANKAYLLLTDRSWPYLAKELTIDWETTGIKNLTPALSEGKGVYNLQGVRVNNGYQGVVIMNGKKYINK